jgi:hypothetical protein
MSTMHMLLIVALGVLGFVALICIVLVGGNWLLWLVQRDRASYPKGSCLPRRERQGMACRRVFAGRR